nr:MAG: hypothetical protein [Apis mellifera filamentous virus]
MRETNIINRRQKLMARPSDKANTTETAKEDDQDNEQHMKQRRQLHNITKIQKTNQIATKRQTTNRKIKENNETPPVQTTYNLMSAQHHHS